MNNVQTANKYVPDIDLSKIWFIAARLKAAIKYRKVT